MAELLKGRISHSFRSLSVSSWTEASICPTLLLPLQPHAIKAEGSLMCVSLLLSDLPPGVCSGVCEAQVGPRPISPSVQVGFG